MAALIFQFALGLIGCGAFWFLLRQTGLMHFGLALYASAGAFASVAWMKESRSWLAVEGQVALAPVVAACAAGLLAAVLSRLVIKRSGLTFAMLSLAVAEMAYLLAPMWPNWTAGEAGFSFSRGHMSHVEMAIMASFWAWMCVLVWRAWMKRPMALWAAVHRDREERLALWGIQAFDVRFQTHAWASAAMGLWGGLTALWLEHVSVQMLDPMLSAWLLLFGWLGGPSVLGLLMGVSAWAVFRAWAGAWSDSLPLWLGLLFVTITLWRSSRPTRMLGWRSQDARSLPVQTPDSTPMAAPIPVTDSSPVVLSLSQVSVVAEDAVLLKPISLELRKGERLGVRGVNGAGKSTLLKAITGEKSICEGGAIVYGGQNITHASVVERAKMGITRSYQCPALFDQMSVLEHVMASIVSRERRFKGNPKGRELTGGPSCPRSDLRAVWQAEAMDWLSKVDMTAMANGTVEQLSYAHQRILECVMTAAFAPSLALLDEPTAGMNPAERQAMCRMIDVLFAHSTLILVEHDPDVLESLCHRVIEITPC